MRFVQTIVRVAALSSAAFGSERSELDDAPWETTAGQGTGVPDATNNAVRFYKEHAVRQTIVRVRVVSRTPPNGFCFRHPEFANG